MNLTTPQPEPEKPHLDQMQHAEMVLIECLTCCSHKSVPFDQFHGHEACEPCGDTTNHVIVGSLDVIDK